MSASNAIMRAVSQSMLFDNATVDEELDFVRDQIRDPFGSETENHLRHVKDMIQDPATLDEVCNMLFREIQDVYQDLTIDVSDYDQKLYPLCRSVYKFFVRNPRRHMYNFILQYLLNNRNRRNLVEDQMGNRFAEYPKGQYGKREFYVLIIQLDAIVKSIFSSGDIELGEFIEYLNDSGEAPACTARILSALEEGTIVDHGVVADMFRMYRASSNHRRDMNRLEMELTRRLIMPYLDANGLMEIRFMPVEEVPEEDEDDVGDDAEERRGD